MVRDFEESAEDWRFRRRAVVARRVWAESRQYGEFDDDIVTAVVVIAILRVVRRCH